MNNAAKVMTTISNKLDNQKLTILGKELVKENIKLELKSEKMKDALDGIGESIGNEEEEKELYNQVFQEVGFKISEEMVGTSKDNLTDEKVKNGPQKELVGVDNDLDAKLKSLG